MTVTSDVKTSAETAVTDRRRPGRIKEVNPALLPILRSDEYSADADELVEFDEPDQIAGVRGLFFGVAISAPLWVGIAYLGRWILT